MRFSEKLRLSQKKNYDIIAAVTKHSFIPNRSLDRKWCLFVTSYHRRTRLHFSTILKRHDSTKCHSANLVDTGPLTNGT